MTTTIERKIYMPWWIVKTSDLKTHSIYTPNDGSVACNSQGRRQAIAQAMEVNPKTIVDWEWDDDKNNVCPANDVSLGLH